MPIVDRVVCVQKLCAVPIVDRTFCVCMCASASVCPIMHPQLLFISKHKQLPSPLFGPLWPRSTPVITSADGTPPQAMRYAGELAVEHIHKVEVADTDVGEYANFGDALGFKAKADQEIYRLDVRS